MSSIVSFGFVTLGGLVSAVAGVLIGWFVVVPLTRVITVLWEARLAFALMKRTSTRNSRCAIVGVLVGQSITAVASLSALAWLLSKL